MHVKFMRKGCTRANCRYGTHGGPLNIEYTALIALCQITIDLREN